MLLLDYSLMTVLYDLVLSISVICIILLNNYDQFDIE